MTSKSLKEVVNLLKEKMVKWANRAPEYEWRWDDFYDSPVKNLMREEGFEVHYEPQSELVQLPLR